MSWDFKTQSRGELCSPVFYQFMRFNPNKLRAGHTQPATHDIGANIRKNAQIYEGRPMAAPTVKKLII